MAFLLWLAAALAIAWFVLVAFVKVASFGVHLLLFVAVVAFVAWVVRRGTTGNPRTRRTV